MQVDWSFAPAPDGPEAAPAPAPPPDAPRRRRWPRRRLALLLGLALIAALGAWLFTRLGWRRLQDQLAAQIVYEDQRAQAGDVGAVLALQTAGSPAWRAQLAAQVRLGLAAPAPSGDLRPAGSPPRLTRLDALSGDLFAATITRDYLDPAGQSVSFDLAQTYRNLSPGVWERQPPDTSALTATTLFTGQHLSVTVPTADLPWLGPALLQADTLIGQACADWGDICRPDVRMPVRFGAPPSGAQDTSRWADSAPRTANLPRIFFVPSTGPADVLPTPLLIGRPHDAAAQATYSRSLSTQLLGLYASQVASGPDSGLESNDYFLDALVARAETRHLGASAAPATLAPHEYIPIGQLWDLSGAWPSPADWHTDLVWRREAFDFLNWELAGQPPAADGRLLGALRQGIVGLGVDDWLATGLGRENVKPASLWTLDVLRGFAVHPVTDWQPYQGLLLACDDGARQMANGAWRTVIAGPLHGDQFSVQVGNISPDGAWLAAATVHQELVASSDTGVAVTTTSTSFVILRLADGQVVSQDGAPLFYAMQDFGWTASNQHLIGLSDTRANPNTPDGAATLMSQPPTGMAVSFIPQRVYAAFNNQWAWSADHSVLLVQIADPANPPAPDWALLTFSPTVSLRPLPNLGDYAALSPAGDRVAYIQYSGLANAVNTILDGLDRVQVLDLASGALTGLAATNDVGLPPGIARFALPQWSPDGQTLAWTAYGPQGTQSYLLSAPAAGGPVRAWPGTQASRLLPAGFSPDGAYLLADASSQPGPLAFWLFDRQASPVAPPIAGWADTALWLPRGHRLVLAGPAGVSSLDPATGAWAWLGPWANCQLRE